MMKRILGFCWLCVASATWSAAAERPNIILILADDLGYGDLGCYGQAKIKTPHMDRLAAEGMRFTQFYAGASVCAPSRCVLMTGKHTGHCRVRGNAPLSQRVRQTLTRDDVTVAALLQQAGYATALVGKWGLGMIARWPGRIQAGGVSTHVGYFGDFLATAMELAELSRPTGLDGISFAPTLLGRASQATKKA